MSKTVIITGANAGIGYHTTRLLAAKGFHIVMACRNRAKAEAAADQIRTAQGDAKLDIMEVDMASFASIRKFAGEFEKRYDQLEVLVNNAGIFVTKFQTTEDAMEMQFGVNHLGGFLLTNLLLPMLKASAPSRIVNVASIAHYKGAMRFDNLMLRGEYNGLVAYQQSKLANVLFTYELSRRLEGTGVTANCLHPGLVKTTIGHRNNDSWMGWIWWLYRPLMISEEQGAATSVKLASDESIAEVSGKYFDADGSVKQSSDGSYRQDDAERLWRVSEGLTGLE